MTDVEVNSCGDSYAMITIHREDDETNWSTAHALAHSLLSLESSPVVDAGPTFDTVLIEYDPLSCSIDTLRLVVNQVATSLPKYDEMSHDRNVFRVPVLYGGNRGPDIHTVSKHTGLTLDEVIEAHTASPLKIRCYGAPSGSPLAEGPCAKWNVPRRDVPRTRVSAGSIALAGKQSLIYSTAAPGGWQLIGQTPLHLVDLAATRPVAYRPGDSIHYYPITESEFRNLQGRGLTDEYRVY